MSNLLETKTYLGKALLNSSFVDGNNGKRIAHATHDLSTVKLDHVTSFATLNAIIFANLHHRLQNPWLNRQPTGTCRRETFNQVRKAAPLCHRSFGRTYIDSYKYV